MLQSITQADFSGGMFRSLARNLIPANGCYDLVNMLLDEDGTAYKRGGTVYKSNAAFGQGLRWVWDGYLSAGRRTVVANRDDFGVLDGDDASVVNLGGSGLGMPCGATVLGDLLFVDGGTMYAGSRKGADYSAGTVTLTAGSVVVTGAGTSWLANVDAGMLLRYATERYYVVASVDSDTQITLSEPYQGTTGSGRAYALARLGVADGAPYKQADFYVVAGQRLVALKDDTISFSNLLDDSGYTQPHVFTPDDQWVLPDGVRITGAKVIRDTVFVFTTAGVWTVTNLQLDLTDAAGNVQQRLDQVSPDLLLWGHAGLAAWRNAIIAPATDGVYLLDGLGAPEPLSRSITLLLTEYVGAGYTPGGGAVFRNHYFLPVLNSIGLVQDVLVCRLDRKSSSPIGDVYPWVRLSGHAAMTALAVRVGAGTTARQPVLLGAGNGADSRVVDASNMFTPTATVKVDADGVAPEWRLETRDFQTGRAQNRNLVRRVRLRYGLQDAGSDFPEVTGSYATESTVPAGSFWGSAVWGQDSWMDEALSMSELTGAAPASVTEPFVWGPDAFGDGGARTRFFRVRFESRDPAVAAAVRSVEVFVRPSGKEE